MINLAPGIPLKYFLCSCTREKITTRQKVKEYGTCSKNVSLIIVRFPFENLRSNITGRAAPMLYAFIIGSKGGETEVSNSYFI
jgi:hypothetical protein